MTRLSIQWNPTPQGRIRTIFTYIHDEITGFGGSLALFGSEVAPPPYVTDGSHLSPCSPMFVRRIRLGPRTQEAAERCPEVEAALTVAGRRNPSCELLHRPLGPKERGPKGRTEEVRSLGTKTRRLCGSGDVWGMLDGKKGIWL